MPDSNTNADNKKEGSKLHVSAWSSNTMTEFSENTRGQKESLTKLLLSTPNKLLSKSEEIEKNYQTQTITVKPSPAAAAWSSNTIQEYEKNIQPKEQGNPKLFWKSFGYGVLAGIAETPALMVNPKLAVKGMIETVRHPREFLGSLKRPSRLGEFVGASLGISVATGGIARVIRGPSGTFLREYRLVPEKTEPIFMGVNKQGEIIHATKIKGLLLDTGVKKRVSEPPLLRFEIERTPYGLREHIFMHRIEKGKFGQKIVKETVLTRHYSTGETIVGRLKKIEEPRLLRYRKNIFENKIMEIKTKSMETNVRIIDKGATKTLKRAGLGEFERILVAKQEIVEKPTQRVGRLKSFEIETKKKPSDIIHSTEKTVKTKSGELITKTKGKTNEAVRTRSSNILLSEKQTIPETITILEYNRPIKPIIPIFTQGYTAKNVLRHHETKTGLGHSYTTKPIHEPIFDFKTISKEKNNTRIIQRTFLDVIPRPIPRPAPPGIIPRFIKKPKPKPKPHEIIRKRQGSKHKPKESSGEKQVPENKHGNKQKVITINKQQTVNKTTRKQTQKNTSGAESAIDFKTRKRKARLKIHSRPNDEIFSFKQLFSNGIWKKWTSSYNVRDITKIINRKKR